MAAVLSNRFYTFFTCHHKEIENNDGCHLQKQKQNTYRELQYSEVTKVIQHYLVKELLSERTKRQKNCIGHTFTATVTWIYGTE